MPFALKSFLLLIVWNKSAFQYIAAYHPLTLTADVLFCACSHLHHIPHWIFYLRIFGMLRHSACVSRQIFFKICKSISSNAAKRRFKDYRPFVLFMSNYSFITRNMQPILLIFLIFYPAESKLSFFGVFYFPYIAKSYVGKT